MDMMMMLGILTAVFFVSLTLIGLYYDKINVKIFNTVFFIIDVIFYFIWCRAMYERGWLKGGFPTLGNISPMIFTMIPLTIFMKDKVREYAYSAIAFLWFGMFLAMFISPEHTYLFDYNTEASLLYTGEALCHMLAALFGMYLIITEQVKFNFEHWIRALIFMYSVILFGVFLNYFFHKRNFGMDPYGEYSIYFLDIFGTFEATFVAYLLGVLAVLILGLQVGYVLNQLCKPKKELSDALAHIEETERVIEELNEK